MRDFEINDMPIRSAMFWNGYSDGLASKPADVGDHDYRDGYVSGARAAKRRSLPRGILRNTLAGRDWRTMRQVEESRSLVNWKDNEAQRKGRRPQRHLDPDRELQRKSQAAELRAA